MKTLSNTSIAAIFAVGLTVLVALSLLIPFFRDKETQTTDEMMLLRYQLHAKYSPFKSDPHLIIAAIDEKSVESIGHWPFPRNVHGDFLLLVAPEQPRAIGWDILFTERDTLSNSTSAAPADTNTSPASTPATPAPASPTPPSDAQPAAPANPPAASPAPTPPTSPPIPAGSPSASVSILNSILIGAGPVASSPAAPAPVDNLPEASPFLTSNDQHFVDATSTYPRMVTGASWTSHEQWLLLPPGPDGKGTLSDESNQGLLPTRALKNVTGDIAKLFSYPHALLPFPELRKESYFGFVNENGESGGGVRRMDPLVVNFAGRIFPNFDLQVLMQYWGVDPDKVIVNLGNDITVPRPDGTLLHIPIDETGQLILNYRGHLQDFQYMSYADMAIGLQDKAAGKQSDERSHLLPLKDALVVVGVTISGTDAGPTPLDNETPAPLVVTHLNAINNMLQGDFLKPVSPWIWMPIYALFLFGTGVLMLRVGIAPMIPMGIFAMLLLGAVGFAAMYFGNYVVPVAMPEVGILLLAGAVPTKRFFGEEREKIRVRKAMGAYLSERVMTKILAHPDGVKLGGVKQVITIMFCDIRGFTAYCDNRDPQEVLNVVNEYFEEMTQVVFKYEGTVDKYIGDCIMAFWNAPDDQPDHAQRAVCCAMEMRYALANFKVKRAGLDTELFECGIGIHTGEALVGNMGSSLKVNYTAMGSTVNLGARLESLTKKLNERILISKDTLDQLTGDFPITDRGEAIIPGFANPIQVYGVGAEQDLGSAIQVGLKLAKKQDYTAEEVTKPIWAPAPLPEDADPNP